MATDDDEVINIWAPSGTHTPREYRAKGRKKKPKNKNETENAIGDASGGVCGI